MEAENGTPMEPHRREQRLLLHWIKPEKYLVAVSSVGIGPYRDAGAETDERGVVLQADAGVENGTVMVKFLHAAVALEAVLRPLGLKPVAIRTKCRIILLDLISRTFDIRRKVKRQVTRVETNAININYKYGHSPNVEKHART